MSFLYLIETRPQEVIRGHSGPLQLFISIIHLKTQGVTDTTSEKNHSRDG